jgi:hypothetical protein
VFAPDDILRLQSVAEGGGISISTCPCLPA